MVSTEQGCYYYHADHLGSSSVVTDKDGKFYEQIEYFPYGETWVHNKANAEQQSTPYKFTSKELDPETGLYYFGARYYDGKLSRWTAADPPLARGNYLPVPAISDEAKDHNSKLPGMGGVFNTINLDGYQYAGQNPVKLVDPDGNQSTPYDLETNLIMSIFSWGNGGSNESANYYGAKYSKALQDTSVKSSLAFTTGFIKGFFGPDFSKFAKQYLNNNNVFGSDGFDQIASNSEFIGQVAGYLKASKAISSGVNAGYSFGKEAIKNISNNPKFRKEFMVGFAKGFNPSIVPDKLNSPYEAIGYLIGQYSYQKYMDQKNNEINGK